MKPNRCRLFPFVSCIVDQFLFLESIRGHPSIHGQWHRQANMRPPIGSKVLCHLRLLHLASRHASHRGRVGLQERATCNPIQERGHQILFGAHSLARMHLLRCGYKRLHPWRRQLPREHGFSEQHHCECIVLHHSACIPIPNVRDHILVTRTSNWFGHVVSTLSTILDV